MSALNTQVRAQRLALDAPEWYARPDHLPVRDLAAAAATFSVDLDAAEAAGTLTAEDAEATFAWRMENYKRWRCGWTGPIGRPARPDTMFDHDRAVHEVLDLCRCLHAWETIGSFEKVNRYLETGTRGLNKACTKCGTVKQEVTWTRNWSGD